MKVKYKNNAATTLAVAVEVGHTEMTVANGSVFPALLLNNWTYVSVEEEVVKVTGIDGNVLTCEAFVWAHDVDSSVEGRVTIEVLDDAQDVDIYTVPANLPAPGTMRLGELWANAPDKVFGIGDESGNPIKLNAVTVHSSTAKYYVNDIATYLGSLYRCAVEHTARTFNGSYWEALSKINDNLFINPNFKINQERYGESGQLINTGDYGHDLWKSMSNAMYAIMNGAFTIVAGILGQQNDQIIANHGNTVTLSIKSGSLNVGPSGGAANTLISPTTPYTFVLDKNAGSGFIEFTYAEAVKGIKLELGLMATGYSDPDPVLELNKCLSYSWIILCDPADKAVSDQFVGVISVENKDNAKVGVNTPVAMRALPVVFMGDNLKLTQEQAAYVSGEVNSMVIDNITENHLLLSATSNAEFDVDGGSMLLVRSVGGSGDPLGVLKFLARY